MPLSETPQIICCQQILSFFCYQDLQICYKRADHQKSKKQTKKWMCKHLLLVSDPCKPFGKLVVETCTLQRICYNGNKIAYFNSHTNVISNL